MRLIILAIMIFLPWTVMPLVRAPSVTPISGDAAIVPFKTENQTSAPSLETIPEEPAGTSWSSCVMVIGIETDAGNDTS